EGHRLRSHHRRRRGPLRPSAARLRRLNSMGGVGPLPPSPQPATLGRRSAGTGRALSAGYTPVCPVMPATPIPDGPRVLVVDEDAAARTQLGAMGREKLLAVVAVGTPEEALDEAARGHFDAAVIDASL